VDGLWATKSEGLGLIVRAISFQEFQPMWSWSHQRHRQTDRQTDDMQSQYMYRAMHYASRCNQSRQYRAHIYLCLPAIKTVS